MIDINFYMSIQLFKKFRMSGNRYTLDQYEYLEANRSYYPTVFNIETTNACNMSCPFCPRTTQMTRPVKTMKEELFSRLAFQIKPHPDALWKKWVQFAQDYYHVHPLEQSEDAFFLYILPRVIVLHGYGDPLLDKHLPIYVRLLTDRGIPSYFSCNPGNINLKQIDKLFYAGLDYIKFSVDSTTDPVRGRDDYERDIENIQRVIQLRNDNGGANKIIVTMINTGREQFEELKSRFNPGDVYIYQKSLDQAWMTGSNRPQSIHWREFCQFPWSSMSINSSGMVVPCGEDYNAEIVLGDANRESLVNIWNGPDYDKFRKTHTYLDRHIKCTDRCDMRPIGGMR